MSKNISPREIQDYGHTIKVYNTSSDSPKNRYKLFTFRYYKGKYYDGKYNEIKRGELPSNLADFFDGKIEFSDMDIDRVFSGD